MFVVRRALEAAGDEFIDGEYGVLGNHDTIQMAPSLEAIDTATPDRIASPDSLLELNDMLAKPKRYERRAFSRFRRKHAFLAMS